MATPIVTPHANVPPQVAAATHPTVPPNYLPETPTPNTTRATSIPGGLPHDQSSMLHDLSSIALNYANPVAPGQVNRQQAQVLSAWRENANSDYSQFMLNQGLSGVVQNPGALFNEEALVAQAQWSSMDTKGALDALGLSARDYAEYMKLEEQKRKSEMSSIFKVVGLAATLAVGFATGGAGFALAPAIMGAANAAGNAAG